MFFNSLEELKGLVPQVNRSVKVGISIVLSRSVFCLPYQCCVHYKTIIIKEIDKDMVCNFLKLFNATRFIRFHLISKKYSAMKQNVFVLKLK